MQAEEASEKDQVPARLHPRQGSAKGQRQPLPSPQEARQGQSESCRCDSDSGPEEDKAREQAEEGQVSIDHCRHLRRREQGKGQGASERPLSDTGGPCEGPPPSPPAAE